MSGKLRRGTHAEVFPLKIGKTQSSFQIILKEKKSYSLTDWSIFWIYL